MIAAIEIIAVVLAFLELVLRGVDLVRRALTFGRTVKAVISHNQPLIFSLMAKADTAQRHVFSITGRADRFQRRLPVMMKSIGRLMYIVNALKDSSGRISLSLRKLGF